MRMSLGDPEFTKNLTEVSKQTRYLFFHSFFFSYCPRVNMIPPSLLFMLFFISLKLGNSFSDVELHVSLWFKKNII